MYPEVLWKVFQIKEGDVFSGWIEEEGGILRTVPFPLKIFGQYCPSQFCKKKGLNVNPNIIGRKHSLIVLRGGILHRVSVLTSLLKKKLYFFLNFELKLCLFVMTKTVSNREICLLKQCYYCANIGTFPNKNRKWCSLSQTFVG